MKQPGVGQDTLQRASAPGMNDPNFETTFDVDGHIKTKGSPDKPGEDLLPASLDYREDGTVFYY